MSRWAAIVLAKMDPGGSRASLPRPPALPLLPALQRCVKSAVPGCRCCMFAAHNFLTNLQFGPLNIKDINQVG